ncbi:MAG: flagellar hook-length control protein FliK [Rhodospirillaceae bacterium]|nr:flagellar hook-length control protein FliK [Rhodospirillaceae bacterium]
MDVSSTDSKTIVVAAKAVAKSGDGGSKSDEFATTLASMLSKTGSRMGEGSSNGLQSSSSDALEDGNVGGGDNGEEMAEARKSVHDDSHDEPDYDDDRPVETSRDDRNDYDDREPVGNNDDYRAGSDDGGRADNHDEYTSETPDNAGNENEQAGDAPSDNDDHGGDQGQAETSASQGTGEQNNAADRAAAAVAGGAQAALAGTVQGAAKTGDTPVAAVTAQLQAAMGGAENTKGNNQSGQDTGRSNSANGLNQALGALGKDVSKAGTENVEADAAHKGAKTATASKGDGKINLQNQATTNTAQTAGKVAENMPPETDKSGRGADAASTKANQAAAIAKAVGGDTKVGVEVKVENTADTLVSRPRTSLTPTAITDAAKGNNQQQTQTQAGNTNTAQGVMQSGQQMAAQAGTQLGANNAGKGAAGQGAAVQGASASSAANAGAAPVSGGGSEGINNLTPNQNAQQATAAQKPERPAPSQRNVMEQVTVQITKAVNSGLDKINIQLRPASLGRVDVQLEMSGDGRISATILADNKDTLDMLQRGARDLAKALNDAGLQTDQQDLNFSLREHNQQQAGNGGSSGDEKLDFSETEDQVAGSNDIDDPAALEAALRKLVSDGRVDIRA